MNIPLDLIGVFTGIIGTITGSISLVWHITQSKPKLNLESANFKKGGFGIVNVYGKTHLGVRINLRNLGNRSITIENLFIKTGNCSQIPNNFKPFTIPQSSSEKKEYEIYYDDNHFKEYFSNGKIEFGLTIIHTFGKIKKSGKTDFKTGYFTIN